MDIVIDFDGTCVTHEYPAIGRDIGATPVLCELVDAGHRLILFTMRSDNPKRGAWLLRDAVKWFEEREIPLYGIQSNPSQQQWTSSPKVFGDIYIDDSALGCPLVYPEDGKAPFVDWLRVREIFVRTGIL